MHESESSCIYTLVVCVIVIATWVDKDMWQNAFNVQACQSAGLAEWASHQVSVTVAESWIFDQQRQKFGVPTNVAFSSITNVSEK